MKNIATAIVVTLSFMVIRCTTAPTTPPGTLRNDAATIEQWGRDPQLVAAVARQNAAPMTIDEIQRIDQAWTAGGEESRATALMSNAAALRLRELVSHHGGYAEAFLMDDKGALVAMTRRTSDYWQGDEPKFQQSYKGGTGAVFIDTADFDSSTNAVLTQISVPILDGQRVIGALTVGVKGRP